MESGIPLTNLKTVKASLFHPRTALGTLFSVNPAPASETRTDLLSSRAHSKLLKLLENPQLRKRLEQLFTTIQLYDNGGPEHGDSKKGDGIYSAKVTNTSVPGHYRFILDVEGASLSGWPIKRRQGLSTLVRIRPNARKTKVEAIWLEKSEDGSGIAMIKVIPMDKFGNYLGPDYSRSFHVTTSAGDIQDGIQDVLEGSYKIKLYLPDYTVDPDVNLKVFGTEIFKGKLSRAFQPAKRFGFSMHVGTAIPMGNFNNNFDPDISYTVNFEYVVAPKISLEALFGFHNFKSNVVSDTYWMNFSGNVKFFLDSRRIRPFLNGGLGGYKIKNDSSFYAGIHAGAGVSFLVRPAVYMETAYNYHHVFTRGDGTQFSIIQLGFKWRF